MGGFYSTYGFGSHFYPYYRDFDFPARTQEENPKQEVMEKQQRAAVQGKRHKRRTIHIQADKDVPTFLKNFVNKAR